jgi:hypothetical protein
MMRAMSAPSSFYVPDGDDRYVSTELTRGPWSPIHQHGGPPAALIARAFERRLAELGHDTQLARVTIELVRPVPIAPLTIAVEVVRAGRKVQSLAATLHAGDDLVVRAASLSIRRLVPPLELPDVQLPARRAIVPPDVAPPLTFPFFLQPAGYHTGMEARLVEGTFGKTPTVVWMRMRVPLVPGETPSPMQRVLCAADSGNGVSPVLDWRRHTFVNPDLTVYLHRLPEGEWIAMDASTTPNPIGLGLAECALSDERGPIGRSLQSLILEAR